MFARLIRMIEAVDLGIKGMLESLASMNLGAFVASAMFCWVGAWASLIMPLPN